MIDIQNFSKTVAANTTLHANHRLTYKTPKDETIRQTQKHICKK